MRMRGHSMVADKLARLADDLDEPVIDAIAARAVGAVTARVCGRAGVGRGSVARALAAAGVEVAATGDVDVHVIAEVLKPEDRAAVEASAAQLPTLVLLNKADLSGFGRGPMAAARHRCARYRAMTGVPTVPMIAHLADPRLDDEMLAALRMLAAEPWQPVSADDFVTGAHRLPAGVRARLLETLDLYGIAQAVAAVRAGADMAALRRVLSVCSGADRVVAALAPLVAEAGYRRVRRARADLEAAAAMADGRVATRVAGFLRDDDTVIACMAAAVDVVEAAGMAVDPGDDAEAHLSRAAHWHRYRTGPVNPVHRACAADIARGSLRLWHRAQAGAAR
jgi:hypothetical protein